jgi:hypothetical protein
MSIIYINPYQLAAAPPSGYDPDAQAYITAVEAADGKSLETAVKDAINAFVVGCKSDGIWAAIKASCILAGAQTLAGALVPLAGAAPTNYNNQLTSSDYDRKTGLKGAGGTKCLNTNRPENADPQNNNHLAVYASVVNTAAALGCYIGGGSTTGSLTEIINAPNNLVLRSRNVNGAFTLGSAPANGTSAFIGISRSTSTGFSSRIAGVDRTHTQASTTTTNVNMFVFARNLSTGPTAVGDARIAFYSIGESVNLALLDARVSTLMSALAAAIP